MEVGWMMLANYAEAQNGMLYLAGAGWDTINVRAEPPEDAPPDVVTVVQGVLVVRLRFHHTEAGTSYPLRIAIIDEDGQTIGEIQGTVAAEPPAGDTPPTWPSATSVILPLNGL